MHTLAIPGQKCKPDSTMLGRNGSESEKYGNSHRCKPREDILHWKAPDKREWHHHRHQKVKMKWYVLKAQHGTAMADHVVELLCRLVIAELDTSLETSPVVGRGGIPVIQLYSTSTLAFLKLQDSEQFLWSGEHSSGRGWTMKLRSVKSFGRSAVERQMVSQWNNWYFCVRN